VVQAPAYTPDRGSNPLRHWGMRPKREDCACESLRWVVGGVIATALRHRFPTSHNNHEKLLSALVRRPIRSASGEDVARESSARWRVKSRSFPGKLCERSKPRITRGPCCSTRRSEPLGVPLGEWVYEGRWNARGTITRPSRTEHRQLGPGLALHGVGQNPGTAASVGEAIAQRLTTSHGAMPWRCDAMISGRSRESLERAAGVASRTGSARGT